MTNIPTKKVQGLYHLDVRKDVGIPNVNNQVVASWIAYTSLMAKHASGDRSEDFALRAARELDVFHQSVCASAGKPFTSLRFNDQENYLVWHNINNDQRFAAMTCVANLCETVALFYESVTDNKAFEKMLEHLRYTMNMTIGLSLWQG
ncbi:hypothetical protein [Actinomyces vulturis]|uniref:hypothetical protein n=1 Tax=Actinomyces vulturis TaxID=1857645 RepID=UPI0008377670|nr:hypothetical protein [Actinomyces vulturis]